MRRIITTSIRALRHLTHVPRGVTPAAFRAILLALFSLGWGLSASAQCSNMTLNNLTPPWNGLEFCASYDPSFINAPTINYVGTCSNTPSYNFAWEARVNFGAWSSVSSGSGVPIVPGYDPGVVDNTTPGSPLKIYQWRLTVTDIANGNQTATSGNYTVQVGSQMLASSTVIPMTCPGSNDASINLTVTGGLTSKTYLWAPGGQTTEDISGLAAGTYTVTVSSTGCSNITHVVTVSTNPIGTVHNLNTGLNYCSIQAAISDAATLNGHVITVDAGTFNEDVNINKSVTLTGSGCGNTTVVGQIGGDGATMRVSAANVIINGFTITRAGNNVTDWNNAGLNFAGIAVQSQGNYAEIYNNCIEGNRTGIDVNNSNGNNIHNNNITNNRTGLIFRNQTDNTNCTENNISDNWTVGVLFLDASSGSNSPLQQALNSTFNNNNISGNWYGDIEDRQSGGSLPAPGSNMKNFECNWYGVTSPVVSTVQGGEPGYSGQIPVIFGGTATAPGGQPNIKGSASANFDYVSWLVNGTDNAPTMGFQPVSGACSGTPVVITGVTSVPSNCIILGGLEVSFSGGTATYTVSWTGPNSGSASTGSSPYAIGSLAAGTYTVSIVDANGSTASSVANIVNLPVYNQTQNITYSTIQDAINASNAGDIIQVCPGTYSTSVNVNKSVTLLGPNANIDCAGTRGAEAVIIGTGGSANATFRITADWVTINGFSIHNPNGLFGVQSVGRSQVSVIYNIINNIGDDVTAPSAAYGINHESNAAAANVDFSHNCVSNIRGPISGAIHRSAVGIGSTSSNSTQPITNLTITNNRINNINANVGAGRGAYGVIINVGAVSTGQAIDARVNNNTIHTLNGLWAAGVGLEGKTPGAEVLNNDMSNFTHMGAAAAGVTVQQNNSVNTRINNNSFINTGFSVAKDAGSPAPDATCNWHGSTVAATVNALHAGLSPLNYTPWLIDGTDANGAAVGFIPATACNLTAPIAPADDAFTVECAVTMPPAPPVVMGICGPITPTGPVLTGTYAGCEGTQIYTWTYTDCNGLSDTWSVTYTVDITTAPIVPADGGSTVECVAAATAPVTPVVTDACGNAITPLGNMVSNITGCEGTITYSYVYQDCSGLSSTWNYTYTVNVVTPPVVPANGSSTVECPADATAPILPSVTDVCGTSITAVLDSVVDNPASLTCEGTRTYYYSYTDCSGLSSLWNYVYTIDRTTAPSVSSVPTSSTVECAAAAVPPSLPIVTDVCGNVISPTGPVMGGTYFDCEGTITYTYDYTDCSGLMVQWTYTYTIDRVTAPIVPAPGGTTVECASAATQPVPPTVVDVCGNGIIPTGPVMDNSGYNGCEGTITYTYTYTDCSGLSSDWVYTYTIDVVTPLSLSTPDGSSTVECATAATQPIPPMVIDVCGNNITPVVTTSGTYTSCEGTIIYTFTYTDCAGSSVVWNYTYTVDHTIAPVVPANGIDTVECLSQIPITMLPIVTDVCGTPIAPVLVSTVDAPDPLTCQGTRTFNYTYTDCSGLSTPWSITYHIIHSTAPVVPAPGSSVVSCVADAIAPAAPTVVDVCGNAITPTGPVMDNSGFNGCSGPITYTYTYTDCAGLFSTWTYTYTVSDTTPPTILTAANSLDATLQCTDLTGIAAALLLEPTATDNCANHTANLNLVSDISTPDPMCANAYTRVRTWNFNDGCGNISSTFTQTIQVIDTQAPVIGSCAVARSVNGPTVASISGPAYSAVSAPSSYAEFSDGTNQGVATDCGVINVTYQDAIVGTCPTVVTRTWTLYDGCSNSVTCDQTITMVYNTPPSVDNQTHCNSYTWANGNTYTTSGMHTHTFTNAAGCDSIVTLNLTINYSTFNSTTVTQALSYTWPINGATYTLSGTYTSTYLNGFGCLSADTLNLTITGVSVLARVLLDGPYQGGGIMHDSLRDQNLVPTIEPYSVSPYLIPAVGYPNLSTTSALGNNGNNSVVDWIVVELRGTSAPFSVVARKHALLQRDGDIVDLDGVSPLVFPNELPGNYRVSVKHRNHLGVMTNNNKALTLAGVSVDFTTEPLWVKPSIPAIVNTPAKTISGLQVLWSGDANVNKGVRYNGFSNDKEQVLNQVGIATPNNTVHDVYRPEDVNMDSKIRYNNADNDRVVILGTVGVSTPNNTYNQHTPN